MLFGNDNTMPGIAEPNDAAKLAVQLERLKKAAKNSCHIVIDTTLDLELVVDALRGCRGVVSVVINDRRPNETEPPVDGEQPTRRTRRNAQ